MPSGAQMAPLGFPESGPQGCKVLELLPEQDEVSQIWKKLCHKNPELTTIRGDISRLKWENFVPTYGYTL